MSVLARCCCRAVALAARCRVPDHLDATVARLAVVAIRFYQRHLSGRTGTACLFTPSCSQRAIGWLEAHGFNAGTRLADAQLGRCGGVYSLSVTTQGETWLVTHDEMSFGPGELSLAARGRHL
ncbi:membrane protein insertion efficiency factor YidD [Caulobacter sp. Root342]|uniref:membrane protein insertion efficiency factor YidD n=1 Tax=unclassified Caulobacter TaxID=2648921 RepID=UPI0035199BCB